VIKKRCLWDKKNAACGIINIAELEIALISQQPLRDQCRQRLQYAGVLQVCLVTKAYQAACSCLHGQFPSGNVAARHAGGQAAVQGAAPGFIKGFQQAVFQGRQDDKTCLYCFPYRLDIQPDLPADILYILTEREAGMYF